MKDHSAPAKEKTTRHATVKNRGPLLFRPGRDIPKQGLHQRAWRFEQTFLLWCCKCPATPAVVPLGYSFPCRGAYRLSPPLEDIGRTAICKFRLQNHGGHSHA